MPYRPITVFIAKKYRPPITDASRATSLPIIEKGFKLNPLLFLVFPDASDQGHSEFIIGSIKINFFTCIRFKTRINFHASFFLAVNDDYFP
jgi:hypothetical protein